MTSVAQSVGIRVRYAVYPPTAPARVHRKWSRIAVARFVEVVGWLVVCEFKAEGGETSKSPGSMESSELSGARMVAPVMGCRSGFGRGMSQ